MRPETQAALDAGRAHFNAGRFFEAHEVWETAWRREDDEARLFLQALILTAAGCHKATQGQPRGVVKLLGTAKERLALVPDRHLGHAMAEFREQVSLLHAAATGWLEGGAPIRPCFTLNLAAPIAS